MNNPKSAEVAVRCAVELSRTCSCEHLSVSPGLEQDLDHIGVPLGDGQVEGGVIAVVQHNLVPVSTPLQQQTHYVTMARICCVVQSCPASPSLTQGVYLSSYGEAILNLSKQKLLTQFQLFTLLPHLL